MNRPTANRPDDDGLRGWILEAGNPAVEPRPEHVEQVRAALFERLDSPAAGNGRRHRLVAGRLAVAAAGLLMIGLAVAVLLLFRPGNAWARITQAVQEKPWVHIVGHGPQGTASETWMSPRFGILAATYDHGPEHRGAEYIDLKTGIKNQYVAKEDTVYRLRELADVQGYHAYTLEAFRQLLGKEAFRLSPLPQTEIVDQTVREIIEDGKAWKQFEARIRWKEGRKSVVKMVLRVDPATGLPRTWDIHTPEGVVRQTVDYPETGPPDLFAMGVPATAKPVDRVPGEDLNRLLEGMKLGRSRFDDYCAYVWYERERPSNVQRVWRKGHRWRVEMVRRRLPTRENDRKMDQPPFGVVPGADLAWWNRHESEMIFEPSAICDGQTIWYYRYDPAIEKPDQPYLPKRRLHMTQTLHGPAEDRMMPWPHLMPEHQSHPNVYVPTSDREFSIDPHPTDGPPGTIRLRVRDAKAANPGTPDLYRLWIDPVKTHVATRAEMSVFDGSGQPGKLAYVDTQVITDLGRSPGGFWYPTRVVRKTSHYPTEQVTRFLLDFRVEIPDSLFRPLE